MYPFCLRNRPYHCTIITPIIFLVPTAFDIDVCVCMCGIDITLYTFKNQSYVNTLRLASFFHFPDEKTMQYKNVKTSFIQSSLQ